MRKQSEQVVNDTLSSAVSKCRKKITVRAHLHLFVSSSIPTVAYEIYNLLLC